MDPRERGPRPAETAPLAYDPREENPLMRALLAGGPGGGAAVDLAVHADDEMLGYLVDVRGGDRDAGLVAYFDSGRAIVRALSQLVAWRFGVWSGPDRILDFASGYGRVTRFLVRQLPPERVWVAEIHPRAVAFQADRFGVHGLPSTRRAADFRCPERFDAVFATSLFTHLPEEAFRGWLARLLELLAPGGMLVFTTHDPSLLPAHEAPAGGFLFRPVSESRSLAAGDYGSTWAGEGFVRRTLEEAVPGCSWRRIPRGLINLQDLYVVAREPGADFSSLDFRGEPGGYVETFFFDPSGRLHTRGWAHDGGWGRPVEEVRLRVDGRVAARCRAFGRRPDVAERFGVAVGATVDWNLTGEVPAGVSRSRVVVAVEVLVAGGGERPLHLSSLESALLWSARRDLDRARGELEAARAGTRRVRAEAESETARLEATISAMEASRFWKLRNAWFRLKRRLGLAEADERP